MCAEIQCACELRDRGGLFVGVLFKFQLLSFLVKARRELDASGGEVESLHEVRSVWMHSFIHMMLVL